MQKLRTLSGILAIVGVLVSYASNAAQEPTAPKASKEFASVMVAGDLLGEHPKARAEVKANAADKKALDRPMPKVDLVLPPRPGPMHVGLDVLVNGKPLRTVQHQGKTYLPVPKVEAEYELRVWNHGPHRIVAIVSVDGLSVMNGQPASAAHPGYIVAPFSQLVIKGWRRSLDTVAAFAFVDRDKSYASRTGRPENIGVIGLIAIEEQVWTPRPMLEKQDSPKASLRAQVGKIGTDYGRDIDSRVHYVPFNRSNNRQTITIYYDTVAALRAAGVPVDSPMPVPFPADSEFAPPPPGYKTK